MGKQNETQDVIVTHDSGAAGAGCGGRWIRTRSRNGGAAVIQLTAAKDSRMSRPLIGSGDHTQRPGSLACALSNHDMPLEEIKEVLGAEDPAIVTRYMELHRERLAEQLAQRIHELEALERILARRSRVAASKR